MAINNQFEDYVGSVLKGQQHTYHIQPHCWGDGDLVIVPVTHDGELFEAQFFAKCQLPKQLYRSRKRRIQRLRRSEENFMEELDEDGFKILISRTSPQVFDRKYFCRQCPLLLENNARANEMHFNVLEEVFPSLCSSSSASSSSSSTPISLFGGYVEALDDVQGLAASGCKPSSFADAASKAWNPIVDVRQEVGVWKHRRSNSSQSAE
ncbi:hypothetical protein LQW54_008304 [Pestalotiopsis sp. IQ-011]